MAASAIPLHLAGLQKGRRERKRVVERLKGAMCWRPRFGTTSPGPSTFPEIVQDLSAHRRTSEIVNEINSRQFADASGRLPKQVEGTTSLPFLDVSCDGFVAPLDALLVINHINSVGSGAGGSPTTLGGVFPSASCSPQLVEGDDFVSQWSKPLVVPDEVSSLEVLIESPKFDTTSQRTIRDAFEIEVFDQSGVSILPSYQFNHEALLNWTEGYEAKMAPGVRMAGDGWLDVCHHRRLRHSRRDRANGSNTVGEQ